MMHITRKRVGWTAGLLLIAGALTAAMWPEPEVVEAAVVSRGPFRVTVDAEARTRTRQRFVVTAPVTGRLERIWLHPGDSVSERQPIAVIAPLPLDEASVAAARSRVSAAQAALQDAETRVRQARESAALAQRNADRLRVLETAGGVSRQQLEEAMVGARLRAEDLTAAEARTTAAAGELSAARAALPVVPPRARGSVVVHAPAQGRVLGVPEASERIVIAGTPIIEIGRPEDLEVVADVLSEDAVRIPLDAPVELVGWGGDVAIRGVVHNVEPGARTAVSALGVDEQRVNVIIMPGRSPRQLGDGYRLDAHIVIWQSDSALAVPASAVFSVGAETHVFTMRQGRARERSVQVGRRSDAAVQILGGLVEGDSVVLFPSDRIRDGARVRTRAP